MAKNSFHLDRLISKAQVSSAALIVFPLGVLGKKKNPPQKFTFYRPNAAQFAKLCAATGNSLHDNDSLFGGSVHVHVVHTCPSPADDLQIVGSIDDVGRNLCCRSHHEAVVVLQGENHGPSFQPSKGTKSDLTRVTHVTHVCASSSALGRLLLLQVTVSG